MRIALFLLGVLLSLVPTAHAQQPGDRQPRIRYWKTRWSFPDIDAAELLSRLQAAGIEIPIDAAGKVAVDFDVSIPLNRMRDAKAYRLQGTIAAKRLRLERLLLEDFSADLHYHDGKLHLTDTTGRWSDVAAGADAGSPVPSGTLSGSAALGLRPLGDLTARLQADSIPIGPLQAFLGLSESKRPASGRLSGDVQLKVPLQKIRNPDAWDVAGALQLRDLRIGKSDAVTLRSGKVTIGRGRIVADQVSLFSQASPDVRADMSATWEFTGQQPFEFSIRANDVPLHSMTETLLGRPIVDGKVDLDLRGQGGTQSGQFNISGHVASPQLSVLGMDFGLLEHQILFDRQQFRLQPIDRTAAADMVLQEAMVAYEITPQQFLIRQGTARIAGGAIRGSGVLSRDPQQPHRLQASWEKIRPQMRLSTPPGRITTRSSGQLELLVPADSLAEATGNLTVACEEIAVANIDVGQLTLDVRLDHGVMRATGSGRLLGGAAEIDVTSTPKNNRPHLAGQIAIRSMRLQRLAESLPQPSLRSIRGTATFVANFLPESSDDLTPQPPRLPIDIRATASDVMWNRRSFSRRIALKLQASQSNVEVQQIDGSYAGGRVQATGHWPLLGSAAKQMQVNLLDVDLARALLPFSGNTSSQIEGKMSGNLVVTGKQKWHARGNVSARSTRLFSIPTGTFGGSLDASVSPGLARWKVRLPSIRGQLAGGRILGEMELKSSTLRPGSSDLASRWKIERVDFGKVLQQASGSAFAHGQMTGTLSLNGRGIRAAKDLTGRFDAELGGTQSGAIPGLLAADRFLGVVSLARVRFDQGHTQGVIGGGAVKLKETWLRSNRVRVFTDGSIQLSDGGMDLAVVISTGSFYLDDAKILALATQLAIQSALPIAGLVEINRLLANRTVHLQFTGPLTNPRLRLKPLEIIREEAARFLLREILVASSIASDL